MNIVLLAVIIILYLFVVILLGYFGFKRTKDMADYMVAGRGINPFIMALSYGATFISTSAIVGFGGVAGNFGLGLLWLTFLNIFVGIYIAFVFFGKRTRAMGHRLNAHTFPELLGKRYKSKFIQVYAGIIILFMILYTAVVLIGAARFIQSTFKIDYNVALLIFSVIVASYVIAGGLKGVMYTDALQGSIMFIGMVILLIYTYSTLGGVSVAHKKLDGLMKEVEVSYAPQNIRNKAISFMQEANLSIDKVDVIIKETKAILKASKGLKGEDKKVFVANRLKEVADRYFGGNVDGVRNTYKRLAPIISQVGYIAKIKKLGHQGWARMPKFASIYWWILVSTIIMGVGIGVLAQPQLAVRFMTVSTGRELNRAVSVGGIFILAMTGVAFVVGSLSNVYFWEKFKLTSLIYAKGNVDLVIPEYINSAMPQGFVYLFMLVLLSAAMSTNSSQFHALGTAIVRDILQTLGLLKRDDPKKEMFAMKIGIAIMVIFTIIVAYTLPPGFIARGTAIFFGLCAASFLPAYFGAIYSKRITKAGAIAGMVSGSIVSLLWLLFAHIPNSARIGLAKAIFGKPSILAGSMWGFVDSLFIALPISILVTIIVSVFTERFDEEHLRRCFE
jgi:SSS family solute:Na+ symporter